MCKTNRIRKKCSNRRWSAKNQQSQGKKVKSIAIGLGRNMSSTVGYWVKCAMAPNFADEPYQRID